MDNNQNVTVNTEQIMRDIRRDIMEEEARKLPSFEEVRHAAALSRSVDFLKSNNQLSYYFSFAGNKIKVFLKKVVRKLIKCVMYPIVCHQNELNRRYVEAISALHEENCALKQELTEIKAALDLKKKEL